MLDDDDGQLLFIEKLTFYSWSDSQLFLALLQYSLGRLFPFLHLHYPKLSTTKNKHEYYSSLKHQFTSLFCPEETVKKKAYLFTSVAADPKRLAPVRSRSLMVVTVTVWLGWSYCTDSVVLVIASSRSSAAASDRWSREDTRLKNSGPSQSVGCCWLVVGICGFQPTKSFVPLLQHFYIFLVSLGNR